MKLKVLRITEDSTLESMPQSALSPEWPQDDIQRWVDIETAEREELKDLLTPMGLPQEIMEACMHPDPTTRFTSLSTCLYIEYPTPMGWDETRKRYLSIICAPTTIITIHREPLESITDLTRRSAGDITLYGPGTAALLYHIIVDVGKQNLDIALDIRDDADRLIRLLEEDADSVEAPEIAALKRRIGHHAAVGDDQIYCIAALQTVESSAFRISQEGTFYRDLLRIAEQARPLLHSAETRVMDLQQDFRLNIQQQVDNRLRVLTILSAVFLPLTVLGGIYGMNFKYIPAIDWEYGYFLVFGLMVTIVVVMLTLFYRRGWFD